MASGNLLLEVRDKQQRGRLLNGVSLGKANITVTPHRSIRKGVISDDHLLNLSKGELLERWKEQNVAIGKNHNQTGKQGISN